MKRLRCRHFGWLHTVLQVLVLSSCVSPFTLDCTVCTNQPAARYLKQGLGLKMVTWTSTFISNAEFYYHWNALNVHRSVVYTYAHPLRDDPVDVRREKSI
jgi:hypothetical protein